ncbi:MAG: hypothetical protein JW957_04690 [Candidatus Omnitrophica bacterium]|nr:hypothetical protein [Candidatus Omnitrophota bacterium]
MIKKFYIAAFIFLFSPAFLTAEENVQVIATEAALQESAVPETAAEPEQEKEECYNLYYKFPLEREIFYQMNMDKEDEFNVGGRTVKSENKTILYLSQLFESVDGEGNGSGKLFYLQGWQDGQRIFPQEKIVTVKMSPKGEVLESAGLQEVAAEFLKVVQKSLAVYIPGFDRIPLKIDLTKVPSNTFNPFLQSFIMPLPEEPVAVGEKWHKGDRNMGEVEFTLEKAEGGRAYIKMHSKGRNGVMEGNAVFDMEQGIIVSQKAKTDTEAAGRIVERIAKEIESPDKSQPVNIPAKTRLVISMNLME